VDEPCVRTCHSSDFVLLKVHPIIIDNAFKRGGFEHLQMHRSPSRFACLPIGSVSGRQGGTHLVTPQLLQALQYTGSPS